MKVVGDGFLSVLSQPAVSEVSVKLEAISNLVSRAIALCHDTMKSVEVPAQRTAKDKQQIIACIVLARVLEISESITYLARGGFSVEVQAGVRNFLDAYFVFGNVCLVPGFVETYFQSDLYNRMKLIRQATKYKDQPFQLMNEYATDEMKEDLKHQIAEVGATEMKSYTYATNVGCAPLYGSLYRLASAASHTSPRSLDGYVKELDGIVQTVFRGPQLGSSPQRLHDVGALLLNVYAAFCTVINKPLSEDHAVLERDFKSISLPDDEGTQPTQLGTRDAGA